MLSEIDIVCINVDQQFSQMLYNSPTMTSFKRFVICSIHWFIGCYWSYHMILCQLIVNIFMPCRQVQMGWFFSFSYLHVTWKWRFQDTLAVQYKYTKMWLTKGKKKHKTGKTLEDTPSLCSRINPRWSLLLCWDREKSPSLREIYELFNVEYAWCKETSKVASVDKNRRVAHSRSKIETIKEWVKIKINNCSLPSKVWCAAIWVLFRMSKPFWYLGK